MKEHWPIIGYLAYNLTQASQVLLSGHVISELPQIELYKWIEIAHSDCLLNQVLLLFAGNHKYNDSTLAGSCSHTLNAF